MKSLDMITINNDKELPVKHEIDLIIFDLDGTLIDSLEGVLFALYQTLEHFNLPAIDREELLSFIGISLLEMLARCSGLEITDPELQRVYAHFKNCFALYSDKQSNLYPNTVDILNHFKDKQKVIVTNRKREFAVNTLKHFSLAHHFEAIIGSDDTECAKPSGCPIHKVLSDYNCAYERAAIVGDMDIDVYAGKAAGILTCAVRTGIGQLDDIIKADPDYLISDLTQLKEIFK